MTHIDAIGVVEVQYFSTAIEVLDAMTKSADVQFLTSEKLLGGRLVTVIVGGGVSQVTASVEAARQVCKGKANNPLKMSLVISKPHAEIMKFIVPSAQAEPAVQKEFETITEPEQGLVSEAPPKRTRSRRQPKS
ncbi:BMC domain-containing protein [Paenibacillus marinisediminis]